MRDARRNAVLTLADVRELIKQHLPAHFREKATWRIVAKDLKAAAFGADRAEASIAPAYGAIA